VYPVIATFTNRQRRKIVRYLDNQAITKAIKKCFTLSTNNPQNHSHKALNHKQKSPLNQPEQPVQGASPKTQKPEKPESTIPPKNIRFGNAFVW
jgi:hypothetical protein